MLSAGHRFGPYQVVAPLGAGGMGEVYRATDLHLGRDVAVKVLPQAVAHDVERLARLEREARVLAALNHPNIAAVYGLEKSTGTPALVMELVEGPTLADRIAGGGIRYDEAVAIAKQISDALAAAHEQGITHRDLKPANVKVRADGTVKVLDFGLAKPVNESSVTATHGEAAPTITTPAVTQMGVILGTAAYMSPEQARGQRVDKRADIWAFGVLFFEMLTGRRIFEGATISDTFANVIKSEPDFSAVPAPVRPLLRSCLEKDVSRRLRDIGDAWLLFASRETPPARMPRLAWAVAAVASLAAVIAVWAPWRSASSIPSAAHLQLALPQDVTFSLSSPFAISPDGRKLVFVATGPDNISRLWVRYLDSLDARPLAGTETQPTIPSPFWSPDSRFIAFTTGGRLKKVDLEGGPVQTICELTQVAPGGSWNRDGTIIFPLATQGVMRVSAAGGIPEQVTAVDRARREVTHNNPRFLPDGRHFLYLRVSPDPETGGIYVGRVDARPSEQSLERLVTASLGADYGPAIARSGGYLLFRREGSLLAQPFDEGTRQLSGEPAVIAQDLGAYFSGGMFSVSDTGVLVYRGGESANASRLVLLDRQGKASPEFSELGVSTVSISPDGTRVAVRRTDYGSSDLNLWLVDIASGRSRRLTRQSTSASAAVWSPDGAAIAYAARSDLYLTPVDGSREEMVLDDNLDKSPESWSRSGFLLYTVRHPRTASDLFVVPLSGERKPIPFAATESVEVDGQFSPDGQWVAYVSNDSGRDEVYVRGFTPEMRSGSAAVGELVPVSRSGGTRPRWGAGGRELFYVDGNRNLVSVDLRRGPAVEVGPPKILFQLPAGTAASDTTLDGRTVAVVPVEQGAQGPFNVLLNWQSVLRQ